MNPKTTPLKSGQLPVRRWHERLNFLNVTVILFLFLTIFAGKSMLTNNRPADVAAGIRYFFNKFFPPDFSDWPIIFVSLGETFQIAIIATFISILLSLIIALGASRNIAPTWLVQTTRMFLNITRTLPSLIWAFLFVILFGATPIAGVFALTFYSLGYLGKFFSETFESVDVQVARGLKLIGASKMQAFRFGLWPNVKAQVWSHSLWMLEYNIRSASIVGLVGAGGIGMELNKAMDMASGFQKVTAILICILGIVILLDLLSQAIRRWITSKVSPKSISE
ncbi:MAG: phosphonate ABC transporter, permease protein PhnE [Opitutae bacterium]|jgi:phosphonate transport system permease protein|nr:phosphonate ABC transporter, permease protein PhnE [Opitutae bacterium]MBT5378933.1 phosphonate ABC transporter, permease protein PhnE [Opitutae bacterium]MBT5689739.1 phosphonate ABC transporter, permease protein PhnE [Opitutae bacterium]MBT6463570.1 phosphonate ABC transporter, permease protein PhnE [Opitutae bacterium]MBT6958391.1 phosphonate ABC transporter, permease protein PhnE [Opitutae bacterium]